MTRMLDLFNSSQRLLLYYPYIFWLLFSASCSDWLFFASWCSKSLVWFSASSILFFPCQLFFISISVFFISYWVFFMLLTSSLSSLRSYRNSVLNSTSDRSLISISFSSVSGVLICFSIGPCFFLSSFWQPPCVCFYVLGRAALTLCPVVWPYAVGVLWGPLAQPRLSLKLRTSGAPFVWAEYTLLL